MPADRKWFARACAAAVLAHTLMDIDPRQEELEREAPAGAPADPYAEPPAKPRKKRGQDGSAARTPSETLPASGDHPSGER